MTDYTIGLDLGTTNIKACVIAEDGSVLFQQAQPSQVISVPSGAEMDARTFWNDVRLFLKETLAKARAQGAGELRCISITGMAEAGCLIDDSGNPQSRILLWYDRRGEAEAEALRAEHEKEIVSLSGIRLSNVPSIYKLAWLKKHMSLDHLRWCGVPELAALRLSGYWYTEPTLAVRFGGLDLREGTYSPEILSLVGLDAEMFAPPCNALRQQVPISAVMAAELGVSPEVRIVVAGHDDVVAAYGAGLRVREMADSAGTAEALVCIIQTLPSLAQAASRHLACAAYYLPGTWIMLGGAGTTGNLFAQLKAHEKLSSAEIDRLAAQRVPYPQGAASAEITARKFTDVTFLPGISNAQAAHAVYDLLISAFMARADTLVSFAGLPKRLVISGGGASSAELCARKAAALGGIPYERLVDLEAAAYGAARLGLDGQP